MTASLPSQCATFVCFLISAGACHAEVKTWDGRHSIENIEVTMVYFVPRDRTPLPDWKDRVGYFARRIEKFHQREYQGQSTLQAIVHPEPFQSARLTEQLRAGDATFTAVQTLNEVIDELNFAQEPSDAFPILLALSDINWRPLEDFFRLGPENGKLRFEGQVIRGRHFPGAKSGGSRATYLADRRMGWGIVSADGWRVPYCGTDCVAYHEGVGHTVGLPHPEKQNGSVMSLAQYRGWLSESWIDDDQKTKLGWKADDEPVKRDDLFSKLKALPDPVVPQPDQEVRLQFQWPEGAEVKSGRIRFQTELFGPWIEVAVPPGPAPDSVALAKFDRPTPVSYRIDVDLTDGQTEELWGYFQVRLRPDVGPVPRSASADLALSSTDDSDSDGKFVTGKSIDLLALVDVEKDGVFGEWTREDEHLVSPKRYASRVEVPFQPPEEYELTVIAEPLDEPNGLILGQRSGDNRFLVLLNFAKPDFPAPASALENVDGRNVLANSTTRHAELFRKGRPSQIICTVTKDSVRVRCDGQDVIHWRGKPSQLSLSDYWSTPTAEAVFLGAYDCRYRFSRVTLRAISGEGRLLREAETSGE